MLRPRLRFWLFLDLAFVRRFVPDFVFAGAFRADDFLADFFLGTGAARSSSVTALTAEDFFDAF